MGRLTNPEGKKIKIRAQALAITEEHFRWVKFCGSH